MSVGNIYIFKNHTGMLSGECTACHAVTEVDALIVSGGCEHIEVVFLDEIPAGGGA